jgi:hypothetical protein
VVRLLGLRWLGFGMLTVGSSWSGAGRPRTCTSSCGRIVRSVQLAVIVVRTLPGRVLLIDLLSLRARVVLSCSVSLRARVMLPAVGGFTRDRLAPMPRRNCRARERRAVQDRLDGLKDILWGRSREADRGRKGGSAKAPAPSEVPDRPVGPGSAQGRLRPSERTWRSFAGVAGGLEVAPLVAAVV